MGKDPVRLFADHVNRLADHVTARGKIPLISNSSLIKGHVGDFHDIYKSVSLIRNNIVINNCSDGHIRVKNRAAWNPNCPEMRSKEEKAYFSYARSAVRQILEGKSFIQAATNARSILNNSK